MAITIDQLAGIILGERELILAQWRERARKLPSARNLDTPTLNDHMPAFIADLGEALKRHSGEEDIEAAVEDTPATHGVQRFEAGFDIEEIVAEYHLLRAVIHDRADNHRVPVEGKLRRVLNQVIDGAIGEAVKAFATQQAFEVKRRREEYLAFVAHDLRTPLNAIALSARILELRISTADTDPDVTKVLRTLNRNVAQLSALMTHVMQENSHLLTELGVKLERRDLDLWALVQGVLDNQHSLAVSRGTTLRNEVPDELMANADSSLLERILQNLVGNAIEHTPGGIVSVGARDIGKGAMELLVQDNGRGIPADRLPHVFDPGVSDRQHGGLGLGLAIVKTFVEAHGGKVEVESAEGTGTTFRFNLPR